jgi:hypothetical protein
VSRGGCFRAAAALPAGAEVRGLRVRAHTRPARRGEPALAPGSGRATLTRINRLFRLQDDFTPGPDRVHWTGEARLTGEGAAFEVPLLQ